MKRIAAIDPGASGGITYITHEGTLVCLPMPQTDGEIVDALRTMAAHRPELVLLEDVGGYIGVPMPGSAMWRFGFSCGLIKGALMSFSMRIEMVKPQAWQKPFSLGTVKGAGGKGPWKNKLKQRAEELFPDQKVTLKTADALLILEYGRRQNF